MRYTFRECKSLYQMGVFLLMALLVFGYHFHSAVGDSMNTDLSLLVRKGGS